MTEIDYKRIYNRTLAYAHKRRLENFAEDFAQECCLKAFLKQTNDIYLARRFIDYLEHLYGQRIRKPSKPGKSPRKINLRPKTLSLETFEDEDLGDIDTQKEYEDRLISAIDFRKHYKNILSILLPAEREIYILKYEQDLSFQEISILKGISKRNATYLLQEIQEKIDAEVSRLNLF